MSSLKTVCGFICCVFAGLSGQEALAGNCNPDAGFEWCYEYPNAWAPTPKLQVDTNYNTTSKNNYTVAKGQYIMRFSCSGTLYYGSNSCWYGGCNGTNLGGGVSQKAIATAYAYNPQMAEIRCYTQDGDGWSYAGFNPWSSGVYVVHCYDNSHCSNCQYCTASGAPSGWNCQTYGETCNSKDDDCDGKIDEDWPTLGNACTAGVGECFQSGQMVCNDAGNGTKCSVAGGTPQVEKCDAKDNDCDGAKDEDFDLGNPCTVGVGQCVNSGTKVCKADGSGTQCSVDPLPAQAELCDGLDNDCDGNQDEDWLTLDTACTVGVGECANSGKYVCKADKTGVKCSVDPLLPKAEDCDGKDNDCDGKKDEDWPNLDEVCSVGVGECVNSGKYVCKADGSGAECSVVPLAPKAEVCDAKDNDCDGSKDEDFDLQDPCIVGVGECVNSGVKVCKADETGTMCSVGPLPSMPELCDAKDNDCDGSFDEDFDKGVVCSVGVGECVNYGNKVCKKDGSGTECPAAPLAPKAETCDGKDNDCDGEADEDFDPGTLCVVGVGECKNTGVKACKKDGSGTECPVSPLPSQAELCDGKDNDCDGEADNGFDLGTLCEVGVGQCLNAGTMVCRPDHSGSECSVKPHPSQPELCDGLDNDCDGEADEPFALGVACTVGTGQCVNTGEEVCQPDGLGTQCSVSPLEPQPESCDALDNDCDGEADNGFDLGTPCEVGVGECKNSGLHVCAADGLEVECSVLPLDGTVELCDGKDNDCDGSTDEDFDLEAECVVGIGECENVGLMQCAPDGAGIVCSAKPLAPHVELCDGLDNDCDEKTDEGFDLGASCSVGIGQCKNEGTKVCKADGLATVCSVEPSDPAPEACDGLDNDCDGSVDEDYPDSDGDATADCLDLDDDADGVEDVADNCPLVTNADQADFDSDNQGDVCDLDDDDDGFEDTADCAPFDGAVSPGMPELCNGTDDDCNSLIDDGLGTSTCGAGVCTHSVSNCVDGKELGCDAFEGAAEEVCDGQDNDCDGETDEVFDDTDQDGSADCVDEDDDNDQKADEDDNCPLVSNPDQVDVDEDGFGDPCDFGCWIAEVEQWETDCDSVPGGKDNCPEDFNPDQLDVDADGMGDACDADDDGDAVPDESDNCSLVANPDQQDSDDDGLGDVCDGDLDGDLIPDGEDNCPEAADPTQADLDQDGMGDVCDLDDDGDGDNDALDCQPFDAAINHFAQESCNSVDDDCDGEVDEADAAGCEKYYLDVDQDGYGVEEMSLCTCAPFQVYSATDSGDCGPLDSTVHPAADEFCNGEDDDCDGETDEEFAGVGTECLVGTGVCVAVGKLACTVDGKQLLCDAVAGLPAEESCDSLDNDCDGETDEAFPGLDGPCVAGLGECVGAGQYVCGDDGLGLWCTAQPGEPENESCDGLDNDCDGETDEEVCLCPDCGELDVSSEDVGGTAPEVGEQDWQPGEEPGVDYDWQVAGDGAVHDGAVSDAGSDSQVESEHGSRSGGCRAGTEADAGSRSLLAILLLLLGCLRSGARGARDPHRTGHC